VFEAIIFLTSVVSLQKKEFSSFDVAAVVRELKDAVLGSRVNNIYQLNEKALLLKLHKTGKSAFRLILDAGRRLHLTSYTLEKPLVPPAFCMGLRKHLRNARFSQIEQNEFDRVVLLTFQTRIYTLKLVLELFGEGNIILLSEEGKILQALVYKRMRDRDIIRSEVFKFAPPSGKNPLKINKKEFSEALAALGELEIVRALTRFLSIGGIYAEEILLGASVSKTKTCNALKENEVEAIFETLHFLVSRVTVGRLEPCTVLDRVDNFVDIVPFKLKWYESGDFKLQPYESFNDALDEFYSKTVTMERSVANAQIDKFRNEADRLNRIITDQEKVLAEAESRVERNRRIGDAIYAHVSDLQMLLNNFSDGKQSGKELKAIASDALAEKQRGVTHSSYFESFDPKQLVVNVRVDDLTFGLALRKTLFENAAIFYERGKREKQRLDGAKAALSNSQNKLDDVEMKMREAEKSQILRPVEALKELEQRKVKRKEWFEKFRWFVSSDGFLVVAGRDAVSNEVLIKKYTHVNDVVFHADIVGAPFVVIKTEGRNVGEQCLREAAEFAAAFSRGWRERFGSVDVYWVRPDQLSKGGPSGESVARGAFMVRGQRNWMRGVPLRLAIGVASHEEKGLARIGGGPVEAVKAKSDIFVIIVPGDLAGKELSKRILKALAGRVSKELRQAILNLSIEKIREFVPYGKGMVLEG
jgi:predicted ribosome quality control (RQC) complex YloA/Tae2 family protein